MTGPQETAPAGKFRVVTWGHRKLSDHGPTTEIVGDYDSLPFAKQQALDLNRIARDYKGSHPHAWVFDEHGVCVLAPPSRPAGRPIPVTSLAGTSDNPKKQATSHKRK